MDPDRVRSARALGSPRPEEWMRADLAELEAASLRRRCAVVESPSGPRARVAGRDLVNLCGNDYLGLAAHPEVREAAARAARDWGAGAGSARLVAGTNPLVARLEEELAAFKGVEAALVFSSGYMANLGAVAGLARRGDLVVCDALNHASLVDAARLSRAEVRVFPHGDAEAARALLREAPDGARRFVVADAVFSMDGDAAPLAELNAIALETGAVLVVDDAHGTGVVGPGGRGSCAAAGVAGPHVVQIATLSKALGSQGGAVCGSRAAVDLLVGRARSFVFETALAPAAVGGALAALGIVRRDDARRERLARNARLLREVVGSAFGERSAAPDPAIPIVPIVLGDCERALEVAARLRDDGFWIPAIRPPTVPPGTARLRATTSSEHSEEEIRAFGVALAIALRDRGLAAETSI